MGQDPIPNETRLTQYFAALKSRRSKTKFNLVNLLLDLGSGWHSTQEIKTSAMQRGISVSHFFSNLLELCHQSDFLETDFKDKYYPRLTSFKIKDDALRLL